MTNLAHTSYDLHYRVIQFSNRRLSQIQHGMQMRNDESAFNGTHKTVSADFYTKKAEQVNIPLEKRFNEFIIS